mmetsp:Transcript_119716/g.244819  ORF Transcript_119716/g.244819 Transcript_119716/m.244819 type:complete len:210 (+) Transcript_119716:506-1135(+)
MKGCNDHVVEVFRPVVLEVRKPIDVFDKRIRRGLLGKAVVTVVVVGQEDHEIDGGSFEHRRCRRSTQPSVAFVVFRKSGILQYLVLKPLGDRVHNGTVAFPLPLLREPPFVAALPRSKRRNQKEPHRTLRLEAGPGPGAQIEGEDEGIAPVSNRGGDSFRFGDCCTGGRTVAVNATDTGPREGFPRALPRPPAAFFPAVAIVLPDPGVA